jgi:hypothetical protein
MWALIGECRNVCTLVGQKHWRLDRWERRFEDMYGDGREAWKMWALIGECRNVCTLVGQKHWRLDRWERRFEDMYGDGREAWEMWQQAVHNLERRKLDVRDTVRWPANEG